MSDINFLSAEEKTREALEAKQNILAKEKAEVKLSTPSPLKPVPAISATAKKPGIFASLKSIFSKKQNMAAPKPLPPKPFKPYINGNNNNNNNFAPANRPVVNGGAVANSAPAAKAEETRGFMAPINAAAWTQNRPEKTAAAAPTPEVKPAEINGKKEEEKKAPVVLENKSSGNFNGNIRPAFLPKRQEIEINLISGEGQVKELTPRAKILLLTAVTAGLVLIFGAIFFIIDAKVKGAMAEKVAVEGQITELNQKIKEASQNSKAVSELQPQLANLKKVLDAHPQARKLFDYLEANTALGVYYTDLGVEVENRQIDLEGVALDYNQAAQQFLIFNEDQKNIKEVELSGISKKEEQLTEAQKKRGETPRDLVSFSLKITLADDFFKQ